MRGRKCQPACCNAGYSVCRSSPCRFRRETYLYKTRDVCGLRDAVSDLGTRMVITVGKSDFSFRQVFPYTCAHKFGCFRSSLSFLVVVLVVPKVPEGYCKTESGRS